MKKIILLAAALLGMTAAQAQVADHVYGTKFTDNWSVTLNFSVQVRFKSTI